jgi:prepilin signal peptidase PulO-like enzyme (type II secretory pathway)
MLSYEILLAGFWFLFGCIFGSFANVVQLRGNWRAIATGNSECPSCGHQLRWYELIPILSFVFQGARCRSCKKAISWQYPLGELIMGLFFLLAWRDGMITGSWLAAGCTAFALFWWQIIAAEDSKTYTVEPLYCVFAAVLSLVRGLLLGTGFAAFQGLIFGMVMIIVVRVAWWLFRREEGMGDGDIWIAAAIGALVGWPQVLVALWFAVMLGAVWGVAVLMMKRRGGERLMLPFGPFLVAGGCGAVLFGDTLLTWYLGTLYL